MSESGSEGITTFDPIPYQVIVGAFLVVIVLVYINSFDYNDQARREAITKYCESKNIKIKFGIAGILKYSPPTIIRDTSVFLEKLELIYPDVVWRDRVTGAFWFYNHTSRTTYYLWGLDR